jgi:GTPase Era involved in 16S rRNA processing
MREQREKMLAEQMKKQAEYQETMNRAQLANTPLVAQGKINELTGIIQQLTSENGKLAEKVKYLEDKMKQLINERIQEKMTARLNA